MVAPTVDRMQRHMRAAFTLLEVLVVLIILSLGAALVVPALRPSRPSGDATRVLMERARGIAVQRGQHLILRVASDGNWTLQADGARAPDSVQVAVGRLSQPPSATITARFTPFGGCSSLLGADRRLDALRCRNLASSGGAR